MDKLERYKTLMTDAIENNKKIFGKPPCEVSADRGYYTSKLDENLHCIGVKNVCVPKIGQKSKSREAEEKIAKIKQLILACGY